MSVVLVRHASAGHRHAWEEDDNLRPLDDRGRRQANGLVAGLAGVELTRVLSSPAVRCVQTVEPLADALGVDVERRDGLAEGTRRDEALALVREAGDGAVLCTHGDVVSELLGDEGPKGAAWILELAGDGVRATDRIKPAG
jgi:phosphohistidine phosphatase SixA